MSNFEESNEEITPKSVLELIHSDVVAIGCGKLLDSVLNACRIIGYNLREGTYSSDAVGTQNDFGDNQLDVDLQTDKVLFDHLKDCGVVAKASSEENPTEISCNGSGYCVAFDPLDGSSIVDANFAVGTILGVWPGDTLLNRCGREQAFSLIAQYGPKVTIALALNSNSTVNGEKIAVELTLVKGKWVVSKSKLVIDIKGMIISFTNYKLSSSY